MIHFSKVIEQKTNRYKMSDKNSRHESMKEEGESVKALLDALLPLCIKTLKPNVANPGCSGTKQNPEIIPWEDVERCKDIVIDPIYNRLRCPICGKSSEELHWIGYTSPQEDWENLAGWMGALSICNDCHFQVEFICVMMN